MLHKHHIVPKHAGGTDDPSNLVELTVEEHALAHKKLWEEYGNEKDRIAWMTLSGQITNAQANEMARKLAHAEWLENGGREQLRLASLGKKHRDSSKKKCSIAGKKAKGIPKTEEHKATLRIQAKRRARRECEYCGKQVQPQMFARWHGPRCKHNPTGAK